MDINIPLLLFYFTIFWAWHGFSISIGYHRALAHKSLTLNAFIEYLMVAGAYLAVQAGPIAWCSAHRQHHKYTDRIEDPHSPKYGKLNAFILWPFKNPKVLYSKELASDLRKNRLYRFLGDSVYPSRPYLCSSLNIVFRILLYFLIGKEAAIASAASGVLVFFSPSLINTLCHMKGIGYRNFTTKDDSRNVRILSWLTFGEALHNNHHRFPGSWNNERVTGEVDLSVVVIKALCALNLAKLKSENGAEVHTVSD